MANDIWVPERDNHETAEGKRILIFMDTHIRPAIATNEKWGPKYASARLRLGPSARTRMARFIHGGPRMDTGISREVSGTGDDAHAHTRVRAIVDEVIIPMLNEGNPVIGIANITTLMNMCRGTFADCYRQIERNLSIYLYKVRGAGGQNDTDDTHDATQTPTE